MPNRVIPDATASPATRRPNAPRRVISRPIALVISANCLSSIVGFPLLLDDPSQLKGLPRSSPALELRPTRSRSPGPDSSYPWRSRSSYAAARDVALHTGPRCPRPLTARHTVELSKCYGDSGALHRAKGASFTAPKGAIPYANRSGRKLCGYRRRE